MKNEQLNEKIDILFRVVGLLIGAEKELLAPKKSPRWHLLNGLEKYIEQNLERVENASNPK